MITKAALIFTVCFMLLGTDNTWSDASVSTLFGTVYETNVAGVATASADANVEVLDLNGKTLGRCFTRIDGGFSFQLSDMISQTCRIKISKPEYLTYTGASTIKRDGNMPICTTLEPDPAWPQKHWSTNQVGNELKIAYGSGSDYPQYGVLHLNDSYFRLVPTTDSVWGTSVIITPSFWERTTTWETLVAPGNIRKFRTLGNSIFAMVEPVAGSVVTIYRSDDLGSTWQAVNLGTDTTYGCDIDCDQNNFYVACTGGVKVSGDLGNSFSWDFSWSWDPVESVCVEDGYGWIAIRNWGTRSGPNRKIPGTPWSLALGDIPWSDKSTDLILADPQNPGEIAYSSGGYYHDKYYRTTNAGIHWQEITKKVDGVIVIDGKSVVLSNGFYSDDQGDSWKPSGAGGTVIRDSTTGRLFTIYNGEILRGELGNWSQMGLSGLNANAMAICQNSLVSASVGNVYRTPIVGASTYHQGSPIVTAISEDGADLVIDYTSTMAGLQVQGKINLEPPSENSIVAHVRVATTGNVVLEPRDRETFKPVMFSSMHLSDVQWDAKIAHVNQQIFQIPASGWLISGIASGNLLRLTGGTSAWKTNAPTVELFFDKPLSAEGYITLSVDPNDDNVGFWPYTDYVPVSWQYTLMATKP